MIENFEFWDSATYRVLTGCGHLYVTVCSMEGSIIKVIAHRKTSFMCDITFFDLMNRATTFMTNRDPEQAVEDYRGNYHQKEGHYCEKCHVGVKGSIKRGELAAYSCADAVSRVLEKEISRL